MASWRKALIRDIGASEWMALLGIGDPLQGDDAAGVLVARRLLGRAAGSGPRALILATEKVPENFTGAVRAFAPDLVVLVDAAAGIGPPGTIALLDPLRLDDDEVTTHRIPLRRLAAYIRETMGARVRLLGIEPARCELGSALSAAVDRAVDEVVDALAAALA